MPERHDLSDLDLSAIDPAVLEAATRHTADAGESQPVVRLGLLVAAAAFLLWLPNSAEFGQLGASNGVSFALTGAGLLVGLFAGRTLWQIIEIVAKKPRARPQAEPVARPLTAGGVVAWLAFSAGAIYVAVVAIPAWSGSSGARFDLSWFASVAVALIVGVGSIRLLSRIPKRAIRPPAPPPRPLPPYFKWVTLAGLGAIATLALSAPALWPGSEIGRFIASSLALVVGVGGAIWLARRIESGSRQQK